MRKGVLSEREKLRKENGEIFTPPWVVNMMLDEFPDEAWEENKTWCDPCAGNGNMLLEVLRRKLKLGHDPLVALQTIWGVELMADNVEEMKERLLGLIPKELHQEAKVILDNNIQCHDAFTWDFIEWKSKFVGLTVRLVIEKKNNTLF